MRTIAVLLILGLTASSVMSANTCVGQNAYTDLLTGLSSGGLAASDVYVSTDNTQTAPDATATNSAKCGEYATSGTPTKICGPEAKVVPAIQAYVTKLIGDLEDLAGTRDEYIIAQRGEVIKSLDNLRKLNDLAKDNTVTGSYADIASLFVGFASSIAKNFTTIVEGFDTYQTARATCMNALARSQGALLCTAMTQYATATTFSGLDLTKDSETATFSDAFVNKIAESCFPFFQQSAAQSAIIRTSVYSAGIAKLVSAIEKFADKNTAGAVEDFLAASTAFNNSKISDTVVEQPVVLPSNCASSTTCSAFIDSLFTTKGILKNNEAILGGTVPTTALAVKRVLKEGNERRLATGGMALDFTKYATMSADFQKNPAGVDNTKNANSALRNGVVACAVAALALFF